MWSLAIQKLGIKNRSDRRPKSFIASWPDVLDRSLHPRGKCARGVENGTLGCIALEPRVQKVLRPILQIWTDTYKYEPFYFCLNYVEKLDSRTCKETYPSRI